MRREISSISLIVDCGRRRAIGVVDRHRHFGVVTRRAVAGAGEDHRVHVGGAQGLVRFSPIAQRSASRRFDLPQPFGPTTPVRPGSIRKSVGSTKDLNRKEEARQFHGHVALLAGRKSPCRDNTIEGNVGVWGGLAVMQLVDRDNGEARAEGQRPRRAFPKAFCRGFCRAYGSV